MLQWILKIYLPKKSDNNGNSDDIYSEPMPADLIDVIGPAPDNSTKTPSSTKMVMDNIDESIYTNFLGQEVIPDTYSSLLILLLNPFPSHPTVMVCVSKTKKEAKNLCKIVLFSSY